jgi:hypothetical protein
LSFARRRKAEHDPIQQRKHSKRDKRLSQTPGVRLIVAGLISCGDLKIHLARLMQMTGHSLELPAHACKAL